MRKFGARIGVLVFVLSLVTAACGKSSNGTEGSPSGGEESGGTMTIGSDTANDHGSKDVSGASSVDVEMDNFYFDPTVIKGTAGQQLTINLENEGNAAHNLSLTDQGVDTDVQPGQKGTVTVTIPQSGFVEFFCKFHKALGMVGELSTA
jgi:plastocyanin